MLIPDIITTQSGSQPTTTNEEIPKLQKSTMVRKGLEVLDDTKSVSSQVKQDQEELKIITQGTRDCNMSVKTFPDVIEVASQQNRLENTISYN